MKTFAKILGGIVAALAVAGGVFYFGWLSPPSPKSVCDNVVAVASAQAQGTGTEPNATSLAQLESECMAAASTPPKFGRLKWVKRLECMRDADSLEALQKCEGRRV